MWHQTESVSTEAHEREWLQKKNGSKTKNHKRLHDLDPWPYKDRVSEVKEKGVSKEEDT